MVDNRWCCQCSVMGHATYMAKITLQVIIFRRSWADCHRARTPPTGGAQRLRRGPANQCLPHPAALQWCWVRPNSGWGAESRYCQPTLERGFRVAAGPAAGAPLPRRGLTAIGCHRTTHAVFSPGRKGGTTDGRERAREGGERARVSLY